MIKSKKLTVAENTHIKSAKNWPNQNSTSTVCSMKAATIVQKKISWATWWKWNKTNKLKELAIGKRKYTDSVFL